MARPKGKSTRVKHGPITMKQAVNVKEAWVHAIQQGTPPNALVTVHLGKAPAKDPSQHPIERIGQFRDGVKAWFKRHAPGVAFVWIEVREKTGRLGEHVHWAFHVPDDLREAFTAHVSRLVAHQSIVVEQKAVDVRPVGPRWWDRYSYFMKGGTAEVRQWAEVPGTWSSSQGKIEGPRIRVAHSIGPSARKASETLLGGHFPAAATQLHKIPQSPSAAIKSAIEPIAA